MPDMDEEQPRESVASLKPASDEKMDRRSPESREKDDEPKPPSKLKQMWSKTGLDIPTVLMMVKAATPPTIAIAMYQSDSVAEIYSTLGYLVAIASFLSLCIIPRARFVQIMLVNVVAVCFASAVVLLALWSSIQARLHTTPPGAPPVGYNSSASAVCAVWLFFQIYVINWLKSARPQFMFPVVLYAIFVNVAMTFGVQFPAMSYAISFVKKLLQTFLTGFALATGVSLFFIPVTSRTVVFKEMTGYLAAVRGLLKAQTSYMSSLETRDMFVAGDEEEKSEETLKKGKHPKSKTSKLSLGPEAEALKAAADGLLALHGKLHADLTFGKREVAYGNLNGDDIAELFRLLRHLLPPLVGLSAVIDIFRRVAEVRSWIHSEDDNTEDENLSEMEKHKKISTIQEWQAVMKSLHEPFSEMTGAMDEAVEHVLLVLQFQKDPKKKNGQGGKQEDVEAKANVVRPGEKDFCTYYDRKTSEFYASKKVTLRAWCERKGISLPADFFEQSFRWPADLPPKDEAKYEENQRQLFMVLYMEYLLWSGSQVMLNLVRFADIKVEDGTMKKRRLILAGTSRLKKWFFSIFKEEDSSADDPSLMPDLQSNATSLYLGDAYQKRKDPEHLPPTNALQNVGNLIRYFPKALRSEHSAFGFRVACATMSIAVVGYLERTQDFFIHQRMVWALIMVAISMNRTAGQSLANFIFRIGGTTLAMLMSFVIYYIVDGKTAGVIVFLWVWLTCASYVLIKLPKYLPIALISSVTAILIIGYELQVRKLGEKAATSNGQPYYPTYELAPYRLATVAGGLTVAYFWTIFPYPITEHSELRKDLGKSLYLLANFYSVVHETVRARVRGDEGNPDLKTSPGRRLEKLRHSVYAKESLLIGQMKTHSQFSIWDLTIGGKFPKETYDAIIMNCENILSYTALIGHASSSFRGLTDEPESAWKTDFRALLTSVDITSQGITSVLSLLSSSVSTGHPLPPYLKPPEPYRLVKRLEALDKDILSIRHIDEPGYAAFGVLQVASRTIVADLTKLMAHVKELVGELDFSFHVISTADSSESSSSSPSSEDVRDGKSKQA